jgi:hypothetical protein
VVAGYLSPPACAGFDWSEVSGLVTVAGDHVRGGCKRVASV